MPPLLLPSKLGIFDWRLKDGQAASRLSQKPRTPSSPGQHTLLLSCWFSSQTRVECPCPQVLPHWLKSINVLQRTRDLRVAEKTVSESESGGQPNPAQVSSSSLSWLHSLDSLSPTGGCARVNMTGLAVKGLLAACDLAVWYSQLTAHSLARRPTHSLHQ